MIVEGNSRIGYGMATATYPANRSAAQAVVRHLPGGKMFVGSVYDHGSAGRRSPRQRSLTVDFHISIRKYALIRAIKRECRYLNIKALTALSLHLVSPAHHPRRRVERRATRILKTLSWLEDRLLPDNTWSFDLGQFATRIRDHPVPAEQLHRFSSVVLDDHSISPEILRAVRR
jgi:hypothetical protein